MGAVLAHVRGHEPADLAGTVALDLDLLLLDEGHVPPAVGVELAGVVIGRGQEVQAVVGHLVPLLAGNLACLAPDAQRRVGEEPDSLAHLIPARWRYSW